jgi:hypothetical protein
LFGAIQPRSGLAENYFAEDSADAAEIGAILGEVMVSNAVRASASKLVSRAFSKQQNFSGPRQHRPKKPVLPD